jgi:hypothetical protein
MVAADVAALMGLRGGGADRPFPREILDMIIEYAADLVDIFEVCFERQSTLRRRPNENGEYII